MLKKIASYADDTAIACRDINDFEWALWHLERYERATGMLRNVSKTEVVSNDPDILRVSKGIGFDCAREVKYLGCQVGIKPNYSAMWQKVLANMKSAADLWFHKSSSIWDRVLQAKA